MRHMFGPILITALLAIACAPREAPVTSAAGFGGPSPLTLVAGSEADEMPASLIVRLEVPPEQSIQALPGTWDTATVYLNHPTVLTGPRLITLPKGAGIVASGSTFVATGSLGVLRPTSGYTLTVDLWSGGAGGTLKAEKQLPVTIAGGSNEVKVKLDVYPALSLTGVSPPVGVPGDTVSLNGQGFSVLPLWTQVRIGTDSVPFTQPSSVSLKVGLPEVAPDAYSFQVQVGSSLATTAFEVLGIMGSVLNWSFASANQFAPAIAPGANQYFVAWQDSRGGSTVYGRIVDSTGSTLVSDFPILTSITNAARPAVAHGTTQYLVLGRSGAGGGNVYGQMVNADGTLSGSVLNVATQAYTEEAMRVCFGDKFLVVWQEKQAKLDISGRIINDNGAFNGNTFKISGDTVDEQNPAVAYDSNLRNYLTVWERKPGGPISITGRLLDSNGGLGAAPFTISSLATANQSQADVAFDPTSGNFLVVWVSAEAPNKIRGRLVSPSGSLLGSELVISGASGPKASPAIAYNPGRRKFVVVWSDQRSGKWDIYGRYLNVDGTGWGGDFYVAKGANDDDNAAVAVNGSDTHGLVAYQDSTAKKIYGQRIR